MSSSSTEHVDEMWVVWCEGYVEEMEDGQRYLEMEEMTDEDVVGMEGCFCYCCDSFQGQDPIGALSSCSVEEVRAALEETDFDLESFDAR